MTVDQVRNAMRGRPRSDCVCKLCGNQYYLIDGYERTHICGSCAIRAVEVLLDAEKLKAK